MREGLQTCVRNTVLVEEVCRIQCDQCHGKPIIQATSVHRHCEWRTATVGLSQEGVSWRATTNIWTILVWVVVVPIGGDTKARPDRTQIDSLTEKDT